MKVSVAVLAKNGGARFRECLQAVLAQRLAVPFEVLVIDSGSRDGSAEFARAQPGVAFLAIEPAQFQHGGTRNLAMRSTEGALVAFLTQDAVPEGEGWLAAHVAFMESHPEVAGAFGRQVAHAGADPLEAWEVACHFESFGGIERVMVKPADDEPLNDAQRAHRHYFSNVNSCIRRAAWQRVPFPELEFGEDQAWAWRAHEAGLATGYAPHAVVQHSHDYGPLELFRRRYDEARFMKRTFGYALVGSLAQARDVGRTHAALFAAQMVRVNGGPRAGAGIKAAARAWATSLGHYAGVRLAESDGPLHACISLTRQRLRA